MIILFKEDGENVKRVEAVKMNEFYVFFKNDVIEAVECIHHSYHKTYDEAKLKLIKKLEQKVRIAEKRLKDSSREIFYSKGI